MLANTCSLERLAEAAEAILAAGHVEGSASSLTALTFAAEVARAEGKAERVRELLDLALAEVADDPERRMGLLDHLRESRRLADCLSLLQAVIRDTPDDGRAAEYYGMAIPEARKRVNHQQPSDPCSCGRGGRLSGHLGVRTRGGRQGI